MIASTPPLPSDHDEGEPIWFRREGVTMMAEKQ
jgi:hypothetical protein